MSDFSHFVKKEQKTRALSLKQKGGEEHIR